MRPAASLLMTLAIKTFSWHILTQWVVTELGGVLEHRWAEAQLQNQKTFMVKYTVVLLRTRRRLSQVRETPWKPFRPVIGYPSSYFISICPPNWLLNAVPWISTSVLWVQEDPFSYSEHVCVTELWFLWSSYIQFRLIYNLNFKIKCYFFSPPTFTTW